MGFFDYEAQRLEHKQLMKEIKELKELIQELINIQKQDEKRERR